MELQNAYVDLTENLLKEAESHRAVNHPYLKALSTNQLSDVKGALREFAVQYSAYSSWFPKYLTATISKMDNPRHRQLLIRNLSEESGNLSQEEVALLKEKIGIEEEWVQGIPHPELFNRFKRAMGIRQDEQPDLNAFIWREQFYSLIQNGTCAEAIGALGLGTESIVKYIYRDLLNAIRNNTDISLEDYVFFELHAEIDDDHGKILIQIAQEIAQESEQLAMELRKGMLKALSLRCSFWDFMYEKTIQQEYH